MAENEKKDQHREAAGEVGKKIGEEAAVMGAASMGIPPGTPGVDGAVRSIGGAMGKQVAQQSYDQISPNKKAESPKPSSEEAAQEGVAATYNKMQDEMEAKNKNSPTNAMRAPMSSPSPMSKLKVSARNLPFPKESLPTPEPAPDLDNQIGPKMGMH